MANEGASPASEHRKCAIEHKMGTINPELGNKCLTEIPLLNKMAESLNTDVLSSCEAGVVPVYPRLTNSNLILLDKEGWGRDILVDTSSNSFQTVTNRYTVVTSRREA